MSTNKHLKIESSELRIDSLCDQMVVAVHDTIREVTTITVATNDAGDTLKVVRVTDRERAASRDRMHDVKEKVVVRTDTVYIAVRDSVSSFKIQGSSGLSRASPVVLTLKWVFWIILALITLGIVLKIKT